MFGKVIWLITWLVAPLIAVAASGLANAIAGGDLHLIDMFAAAVLALWLGLVWTVARLHAKRVRMVYFAGCAAIFCFGAAINTLLLAPPDPAGGLETVDVSRMKPQKDR